MTTAYSTSMFDKIKEALSKDSSQGNKSYKDILKLQVGNVYTVRFVPNLENPEKTFFRYFTHAWESFATGQYISQMSPQTWGKKDPIAETRYSLYKHGTDEEKEKAAKVIRRENWLANVYVVDDPTDSNNNGQVKLLRFGKQINKIVMEAIEGSDSDEFGARVFDLGSGGCNLKIKAEKQGDFPTYVSSRFASPSKIKGIDPDEVYENSTDLESVFQVKSYDELKQVLDEHFWCKDTSTSTDVDPWSTPEPKKAASKADRSFAGDSVSTESDNSNPLEDDKVKELLEGLGD